MKLKQKAVLSPLNLSECVLLAGAGRFFCACLLCTQTVYRRCCPQGSSATTIPCRRKLPSRPWTAFRSGWSGWRFSWSGPRTTANPTDPCPGASPPLPSSNASTARVSSPSSQGHHSRDSVGRRGGGVQKGSGILPPKSPEEEKERKIVAMIFYTFYCVAFLHFVWFLFAM